MMSNGALTNLYYYVSFPQKCSCQLCFFVWVMGNIQHTAVSPVKSNSTFYCIIPSTHATFKSTVDDVGNDTSLALDFVDLSAADGVHYPDITLWHDGLLSCAVIQNHIAVLNDIIGSVATKSGLFTRSCPTPIPLPARS
ncbi:hypothetical protein HAX54_045673 [Datura stramonium]|uniref:Uncharacterized protein n=1 Tax=Datura stramonium TaxID=4076 RepID=A0ABS8RT00_DATST|nr:hypothetical protein [Datura stramonium]